MASPVPPPWLVQPLDPADFDQPGSLPDPGFTQLVKDTLGDAGTPADGFDGIITEVFGLIDALDAASAEQDAVLDALLTQQQPLDVGPLDTTIQNYMGTFDTGNSILASAAGATPPFLGVLPLSTDPTLAGIPGPPALASFDFGTVKLGSPPLIYDIGKFEQGGQRPFGVSMIQIVLNTGMNILVNEDEKDSASGDIQRFHYWLTVTPSAVGVFTAEVTWLSTEQPVQTNLTLTINVVP